MKRCMSAAEAMDMITQYYQDDLIIIDVIDGDEIDDLFNTVSNHRYDSLDSEARNELSTKVMQSFDKRLFGYSYADIEMKVMDAWNDYVATHDVEDS